MTTRLFILLVLLKLLPGCPSLFGQTFPEPTGHVSDFGGVIGSSAEEKMTSLILELKEKTGAEMAVATFSDIGGEEYTDYANRLFAAWKIGQKDQDNGLLIFLTIKERKIRIEVGYGLEGILPDGKVGGILDTYAVPFLRKDDYDQGLYNAAAVVAATIAEEAGVTLSGEPARKPRGRQEEESPNVRLLVFLIILILIIIMATKRRGIMPGSRGGNMTGGWGGFPGLGGGFRGGRSSGGFGGFGGFGGGMSGGGGAGRGF